MGFDPQHDVEVAGRTATQARLAFAADPDLGPGIDPRRDLHRQTLRLLEPALPSALRARVLQDPARPAAGRARGGGHDLAEERLCGAADLARSAASRTGLLARTRFGAAARTPVAGGRTSDVDLLLDAGERLLEGDRHVVAKVVSAVGALTSRPGAEPAPEERVEDVGERHVGEVDGRSAGP